MAIGGNAFRRVLESIDLCLVVGLVAL